MSLDSTKLIPNVQSTSCNWLFTQRICVSVYPLHARLLGRLILNPNCNNNIFSQNYWGRLVKKGLIVHRSGILRKRIFEVKRQQLFVYIFIFKKPYMYVLWLISYFIRQHVKKTCIP